ncbi:hypothetical protein [Sphingomonas sp.]|jgi:hypothetical protein|uniref:hypothetical protein n=1 Tax=Sphingomonas sp. TaxID=28214 RepID=UPI002D7FE0A2|nr:hypothetical protein [Sphingomonas sp.]HEU0044119.1 hypothetical protein [Sphingomonas sp.]
MKRKALILGMALAGMTAAPASAQFYLKSKTFGGEPVRGDEPGIGQPLPGATPAELRASLVWNMRAALNVAALQCQFEPTLLTVLNYNATLKDHSVELKGAFDTLTKYFARTAKSKPAGQTALDQFGTRTYSSFVTVGGQLSFCQTAAAIGRDAVFQPRGSFGTLAANRMAELRQTLVGSYGEQALSRMGYIPPRLPRLDPVCWSKKGEWVAKKCGPLVWPTA